MAYFTIMFIDMIGSGKLTSTKTGGRETTIFNYQQEVKSHFDALSSTSSWQGDGAFYAFDMSILSKNDIVQHTMDFLSNNIEIFNNDLDKRFTEKEVKVRICLHAGNIDNFEISPIIDHAAYIIKDRKNEGSNTLYISDVIHVEILEQTIRNKFTETRPSPQHKVFTYSSKARMSSSSAAKSYKSIPDKYEIAHPVTKEHFFGRKNEKEEIINFIKSNKNIAIIGAQRTGKSSILEEIQCNSDLEPNYCFVNLDFQTIMPASYSAIEFYTDVIKKIALKIHDVINRKLIDNGGSVPKTKLDEYDKIQKGINELLRSKPNLSIIQDKFVLICEQCGEVLKDFGYSKLVFIFDEFSEIHKCIEDSNSKSTAKYAKSLADGTIVGANLIRFLGSLLKLRNKPWLFIYVFQPWGTTFDIKNDLQLVKLLNIVKLNYLTKDDVFNLVKEPVKEYMRYDYDVLENLYTLTGGHPYFTQLICSEIIRELNSKKEGHVCSMDVLDKVIKTMTQQERAGEFQNKFQLIDTDDIFRDKEHKKISKNTLSCIAELSVDYGKKDFTFVEVLERLEKKIAVNRSDFNTVIDGMTSNGILEISETGPEKTYNIKMDILRLRYLNRAFI